MRGRNERREKNTPEIPHLETLHTASLESMVTTGTMRRGLKSLRTAGRYKVLLAAWHNNKVPCPHPTKRAAGPPLGNKWKGEGTLILIQAACALHTGSNQPMRRRMNQTKPISLSPKINHP